MLEAIVIRECELIDPPLRNATFTWSNLQESPISKRLDRFLYSLDWNVSLSHNLQQTLPHSTSDHYPIVLDTHPTFRFENMWLLQPDFKECIGTCWRELQVVGWEGYKFIQKLQVIKEKFKSTNNLEGYQESGVGSTFVKGRNSLEAKTRVKWSKE